jgi:hypothetical protein
MAAVLAIAFAVTIRAEWARALFSFGVPAPRDALPVAVALVAWGVLVRESWRRRLVERFLGMA